MIAHVEKLEERCLLSAVSDEAFRLLGERINFNRENFFVYLDSDSSYNHGFPSGLFGATSKITIATAGIFDPASPTGLSSDPNAFDRQNGTVFAVTFNNLVGTEFAGITFEEPNNLSGGAVGRGYNLTGATHIVFDVLSPTPGGITVRFGVGGVGHDTNPIHIPQSTSFQTISIPLSALNLNPGDLADVQQLFTIGTDAANAPGVRTLLVDNIRFEPVPILQQSALGLAPGNEVFGVNPTSSAPFPPDQVLANLSTVYDNSLALIALLHRGTPEDVANARIIADTFVYALQNDHAPPPGGVVGLPVASDGSHALHDGYFGGDIGLFNSQGPGGGQQGQVRLAGFSVPPDDFFLVQDGATGGNNSFAILGLLAAYRRFGDARYLDSAREIGRWIVDVLKDETGTGFGGYYFGFNEGEFPRTLILAKSIENNADIFAAFTMLADTERRLDNTTEAAAWEAHANHAGDFVMEMFDDVAGRFYAGTVPVGTMPGPGLTPSPDPNHTRGIDVINIFDFLDSNSFTTLAMAGSPQYRDAIDWRRPVDYILNNFAKTITANNLPFSGFSLVVEPGDGVRVNPPDGIAWEFTAQVVVLMRYVDSLYGETTFEADAAFYLGEIRRAQELAPFTDGKGVPAATLDAENEVTGGYPPVDQCLATPFQCIPERVGLAATIWAILADLQLNVFLENLPTTLVVSGAGADSEPLVQVISATDGREVRNFSAFGSGFTGGVRVASADVNGDGVPDIIAAAGPGGGPHVRIFSGFDGRELHSFFVYDPLFIGGVFVAAADLNGDNRAELITSADSGGGPHVRVFDLANGIEMFSFFAYDSQFFGGVRVATGDVTGDGVPDIITGAGPGGGPHVRVFDGVTGLPASGPLANFFAYSSSFTGGVFVAAADFTGDGMAEVVTGADLGGGPHVRVFNAIDGSALYSFFAYDSQFFGGVRVATGDVTGDGVPDIITGAGPGGGPHVRVFDGVTGLPVTSEPASYFPFLGVSGGVYVASHPAPLGIDAAMIASASLGQDDDEFNDPLTGTPIDSDFDLFSPFDDNGGDILDSVFSDGRIGGSLLGVD